MPAACLHTTALSLSDSNGDLKCTSCMLALCTASRPQHVTVIYQWLAASCDCGNLPSDMSLCNSSTRL